MDRLSEIREPLEKVFGEYEEFMKRALYSDNRFVAGIMDYIVSSRGKGIRPLLVFLCAGIHSRFGIGKRAYLAALMVEMIHNASLVHDDVVDGSDTRHGKPTVHHRWDARVSVLSGDYILARSYSLGMQSAQFDIVSYITAGISELVEGELIQSELNGSRRVSREAYLDIIFKKTAILMGVSSGAGAMAAGAAATEVGMARQIGLDLGMAFQIKDDILDYAPSEQTGKSSCADLREGKVTLPLIAIFERCGDEERARIMEKVKSCCGRKSRAYRRNLVVRPPRRGYRGRRECHGGVPRAGSQHHCHLSRFRLPPFARTALRLHRRPGAVTGGFLFSAEPYSS